MVAATLNNAISSMFFQIHTHKFPSMVQANFVSRCGDPVRQLAEPRTLDAPGWGELMFFRRKPLGVVLAMCLLVLFDFFEHFNFLSSLHSAAACAKAQSGPESRKVNAKNQNQVALLLHYLVKVIDSTQ